MHFMTFAQLEKLLANGRTQSEAQAAGKPGIDFEPVLRLLTPDANATWLLTELDADGDTAFGLCDLGHGFPELGYVSLTELTALRGPLGLPVEQDRSFLPKQNLSDYAEAARLARRIVT